VDQSTTVLFGPSGVRVRRVDEVESGARVVHVETAEGGSTAGCPGCGVVSVSVKENVITRFVDLPYGETPLAVAWHKTRWRCREPTCARCRSPRPSTRCLPVVGRRVGCDARSPAR